MTFRELFKAQKGYDVFSNSPTVFPCPCELGYEKVSLETCRLMRDCKSCWEREVPEKTTNAEFNGKVNDKSAFHEKLCAELTETYRRKNHDYGDSFHQSYIEDGLTMAKIRIGDKYSRFKSLIKSDQMVKDESIRDTLMDMANYCIMTVMEMENDGK